MTVIVDGRDRRSSGVDSRNRWYRRVKSVASDQFRKAAENVLDGKDFRDVGKKGVDVTVPAKSVRDFRIGTGRNGVRHHVLPGNTTMSPGDEIDRPRCKSGGAGLGPDSIDEYLAHIDPDEVRKILLKNLGLSHLERKMVGKIAKTENRRAGFTLQGAFHKMDLVPTKLRMIGRRIATSSEAWDGIIECLNEKRGLLLPFDPLDGLTEHRHADTVDYVTKALEADLLERRNEEILLRLPAPLPAPVAERLDELDERIGALRRSTESIPSFDDSHDPRYRRHDARPLPDNQAVMFCPMDVSGSMTEDMKKNAKLFYWLLHNLLEVQFGEGNVDVVFIRHTTEAREVDIDTFFNARENGGTRVSSALELQLKIMQTRYSGAQWNIFTAQVSDGDNYKDDNPVVEECLKKIMLQSRQYVYMQTENSNSMSSRDSDLWGLYSSFAKTYGSRFKVAKVKQRSDVVPVFRQMYELEATKQKMAAYTLR